MLPSFRGPGVLAHLGWVLWSGSSKAAVKVSVERTIFLAHSVAVGRSLVLAGWAQESSTWTPGGGLVGGQLGGRLPNTNLIWNKCTPLFFIFNEGNWGKAKIIQVASGEAGIGSQAEGPWHSICSGRYTKGARLVQLTTNPLVSHVCQAPSPELASQDITLSACQSVPIILKAVINQ